MLVFVRREALKERLQLDRRALQVVDRLLEDRVSEDFLTDCVTVSSQTHQIY